MPQHKPLPPREWLLENLRYEPETGLFWWVKRGPRRQMSKPVGNRVYQSRDGEPACIQVAFGTDRKSYVLHRLAWLMMTGDDPGELTVDHINRNPFDNRWENLRLADSSLQMRNRRNFGRSKHKGVHYRHDRQKWAARATVNGRLKHLGLFSTEEEAAAVAAPYFIH